MNRSQQDRLRVWIDEARRTGRLRTAGSYAAAALATTELGFLVQTEQMAAAWKLAVMTEQRSARKAGKWGRDATRVDGHAETGPKPAAD